MVLAALSATEMASWMEVHSGIIEKYVRSGTGLDLTAEEVDRAFPELSDEQRGQVHMHIKQEAARHEGGGVSTSVTAGAREL